MVKGLFLLIVVSFTNCVVSKEGDKNNNEDEIPALKANYHFNHPPLAEYYNPIPVAVVYEDENIVKLRSEITKKSSEIIDNVQEKVVTEENLQTVPKQLNPSDRHAKSVENTTESMHKSSSINEFQIPVAVIYDSKPNNFLNYHRTRSTTGSPKINLNNKPKQLNSTNVDEQSIEKIEKSERTESNIGKVIFPKRTEGRDPIVPIVESESYVFSHSGNFHYSYEGGDGTKAYSEGKLKTVEDVAGEAVVGGFSYTDKDGIDFRLSYTADENGYRPVGAHLPTPPPIPPAIARALAYLATATPAPTTERAVKSTSS